MEQLTPAEDTIQLTTESSMVSLKPSIGVIVIVIEVELPAVTVTVLGEGEIVQD